MSVLNVDGAEAVVEFNHDNPCQSYSLFMGYVSCRSSYGVVVTRIYAFCLVVCFVEVHMKGPLRM